MKDFEKLGQATYRFRPQLGEYEVREPGRPRSFIHEDRIHGQNIFPKYRPPEVTGQQLVEPALVGGGTGVPLPEKELTPVCRSSGNRVVAVHAFPEKPNPTKWPYGSYPPGYGPESIRKIVRQVTWKINDQAIRSSGGGAGRKLAVDCNQQNEIAVHELETSGDDIANYFSEVYEDGNVLVEGSPEGTEAVKYMVFINYSSLGGCVGEPRGIDSKINNPNATSSARGVASYFTGGSCSLHELLHTLGAVQASAPNGSPGYHCYDGVDVMCYDDGPNKYSETACPAKEGYETPEGVPIDCGYDSYFNAWPAPNNWLATHWNIAGAENPFLVEVPNSNAPKPETGPADAIDVHRADVHGTVNPKGAPTNYRFEYVDDETYKVNGFESAHKTEWQDAGSGTVPVTVSASLTQLDQEELHHVRLVAQSKNGLIYGGVETFTTKSGGLTFTVGSVTEISGSSAVVNVSIDTANEATIYGLEYGTTMSYSGDAQIREVGFDKGVLEESFLIEDLIANTPYHYRLFGFNSAAEETLTGDYTFSTNSMPYARTEGASEITGTAASLHGKANTGGIEGTYQFEIGRGVLYEESVPAVPQAVGTSSGSETIKFKVSGLRPASNYHYRLVVRNEKGVSYGADKQFSTPAVHPVGFDGGSFPLGLDGGQSKVLEFTASTGTGTVKCTSAGFGASLISPGRVAALNPAYGGCTTTILGVSYSAAIEMKSCRYDLAASNAGPPYVGTLAVSCTKEGDAITVKIFKVGGTEVKCTTTIAPQSGLGGMSYTNIGAGTERGIEAGFKVETITNTTSGGALGCGVADGSHSNGKLIGTITLAGKNTAKEKVGAFMGGEITKGTYITGSASAEESAQPRFASESYPAALAANQSKVLEFTASTGTGTVKCTSAYLDGVLSKNASPMTSISPEYGGCTTTILGVSYSAAIEMKSCRYDLAASNAGPPYVGTLAVSCTKEGDAITVKIFKVGGTEVKCTTTIAPQSGLGGMSYTNIGAGTERGIEAGFKVETITNTTSGGALGCGVANGSHSNGKLIGAAVLYGY